MPPGNPAGYIQGNLPFGNAGGGLFSAVAGNDPVVRNLGNQYNAAYSTALGQNQANYSNILQGYQQTAAAQGDAQSAIAAGFPQLAATIRGQQGQALAGLQGANQNLAGAYGQLTQGVLGPLQASGQNALNNFQADRAGITGGYGQLRADTLGQIAGIGGAERQRIADTYAQLGGQSAQNLIGRGLGNTTVRSAVERGLGLDQQRANNELTERLAGLNAQYGSQLGLASLGYQGQAAGQALAQRNLMGGQEADFASRLGLAGLGFGERANAQGLDQQNLMADTQGRMGLAGLGYQAQAAQDAAQQSGRQLDWMNSVSAQYPDPAAYGALLAQHGASQQADRDRALQQSQGQQLLDALRGPAAPPGAAGAPQQAAPLPQGGVGGGARQLGMQPRQAGFKPLPGPVDNTYQRPAMPWGQAFPSLSGMGPAQFLPQRPPAPATGGGYPLAGGFRGPMAQSRSLGLPRAAPGQEGLDASQGTWGEAPAMPYTLPGGPPGMFGAAGPNFGPQANVPFYPDGGVPFNPYLQFMQ